MTRQQHGRRIVGFAGRAGAGKDTCANMLVDCHSEGEQPAQVTFGLLALHD